MENEKEYFKNFLVVFQGKIELFLRSFPSNGTSLYRNFNAVVGFIPLLSSILTTISEASPLLLSTLKSLMITKKIRNGKTHPAVAISMNQCY